MMVTLAGSGDVPAIVALINEAFRVERFFIDGDRIDEQEVRQRMDRGSFLLARDEQGALAGCVYVEPRGARAYLGLLSVDRARRGGGLGKQLMAAAEEHGRAAGCGAMDLVIVNVRQDLPDFYRKLGYAPTGATSPFPPDAALKIPCHFVEMSKPLAR